MDHKLKSAVGHGARFSVGQRAGFSVGHGTGFSVWQGARPAVGGNAMRFARRAIDFLCISITRLCRYV